MNELTVRPATQADVPAIAAIYNHYIRASVATFDTVEKTVEDRDTWLAAHDAAHPVLVATRSGAVVGWGSASAWGTRPGWRHTAELSVYVADGITGGGVGPAILEALVEACRDAGHHVLLAQIVADNEPCLKMAERAGFTRVGTFHQVGRKFDRWIDLALAELVLAD